MFTKDANTRLREAVALNDIEQFDRALLDGADVQQRNKQGISLLQSAIDQQLSTFHDRRVDKIVRRLREAYHKIPVERLSLVESADTGRVDVLEYLLSSGALAESNAAALEAAMMRAVTHGFTGWVHLALRSGASPNARHPHGMTLLMISASTGEEHIVDLLIRFGADVNATFSDAFKPPIQSFKNVNALMVAAAAGRYGTVKRLVEAGTNIHHLTDFAENALTFAVKSNASKVIRYLQDVFGQTNITAELSLHQAARDGVIDRVRDLLPSSDINQRDLHGRTPLMYAVQHRHGEIVTLMLAAKARLDVIDAQGRNLWNLALNSNVSSKMIEDLLTGGLDPNLRDAQGFTALGLFIAFCHQNKQAESIMELLIKFGADIRASYEPVLDDKTRRTAQALREAGKPSVYQIEPISMLDLAKRSRNKKAYALLQKLLGAERDSFDRSLEQLASMRTRSDRPFKEEADAIGERLGASPKPWTKRKGVLHFVAALKKVFADELSTLTALAKESAPDPALVPLLEIQRMAARKHYGLIYHELDFKQNSLTRLLLFPTDDVGTILAACGTNGDNYGVGTREIVNWVSLWADHKPMILGAGLDFMELHFPEMLTEQAALELATSSIKICPDIDESPAEVAQALRSHGRCFFWWD